MKRIELVFGKGDTRIAGNPYGKEVFKEQVKNKIDYNARNVIVFPNTIEKIASSFVQGFFSEVVAKIGYQKFSQVIKVEARSEELVEHILQDLLY